MQRSTVLSTAMVVVLTQWSGPFGRTQEIVFHGLGFVSGGVPHSDAFDVSADGSVVVGSSGAVSGGAQPFRWTATEGITGLGFSGEALGVSADGLVIVGAQSTVTSPRPGHQHQAYRWTEADGVVSLGSQSRRGNAVSSDGLVVVGDRRSSSDGEAFRWTESGGMQSLGYLWNLPEWNDLSAAAAVSADGSVVVGHSSSHPGIQAFRWTEFDGMKGLGDLPGGSFNSGARAVSADGSVIVGHGHSASGTEAFRWTEADGMAGLGDLSGGNFASIGFGISADGSLIVGQGTSPSGAEAMLWDANNGMRSLRGVLIESGMDASGWTLTTARAISADGTTIVGVGTNPAGQTEAWRAVLPRAELTTQPGDFDNDGDVDGRDFLWWQRGSTPGPLSDTELSDWSANYGSSFLTLSVPEMGNLTFIVMGGLTLVGLRMVGRSANLRYQAGCMLFAGSVLCGGAKADEFGSGTGQFTIEFATIGSPGNAPDIEGDPSLSGAVDYVYRISKHEISEQMVEKAVAAAGLDINFGPVRGPNRPVTGVNWVEAALFVNWLNESVGAMPAYKITPPPPPFVDPVYNLWQPGDPGYDPANPYRSSLARYFLPTADEWYKAAYYDPARATYYDFTIGRNAAPQSVTSGTDPFTAVFNQNAPADVTLAGGQSPFGTLGQGGNVFELIETSYDRVNDTVHEPREFRGGYWQQGADDMKRFSRDCLCFGPYSFGSHIGFRVASLEVAANAGDFDGDGDIDGRDFLAWQRDPSVGSLIDWRANYGAGVFSSAIVVPEPITCSAVVFGMLALSLRRDHRPKIDAHRGGPRYHQTR